ncbi:MAG: hypothetical protein WA450_19800, partial [Candidatus Acidiferrales bacterium]
STDPQVSMSLAPHCPLNAPDIVTVSTTGSKTASKPGLFERALLTVTQKQNVSAQQTEEI